MQSIQKFSNFIPSEKERKKERKNEFHSLRLKIYGLELRDILSFRLDCYKML